MIRDHDELRALLDLDPARCDGLNITHPVRRYDQQPWDSSTVAAFPAARHRGDMLCIADRIASGRARGGYTSPLIRRAITLHEACVPRATARADLRAMFHELQQLVAVLSDDDGGSRHA